MHPSTKAWMAEAAGVDGSDPNALVRLRDLCDRLSYRPRGDDWTFEDLVRSHGLIVPFWRVPAVVYNMTCAAVARRWRRRVGWKRFHLDAHDVVRRKSGSPELLRALPLAYPEELRPYLFPEVRGHA